MYIQINKHKRLNLETLIFNLAALALYAAAFGGSLWAMFVTVNAILF